jgi:ABC-type multidrug transport system ATPase subunit
LDNLDDPLVNLAAVYGWFFFHWVVLMGLWWYLDQVLPSAWGVKKHPLFFLGKTHASSHVHTQDILSTGPEHTKGAYDDGTPLPPDVQKEVDAAFLPLDSQSDNYKEGVVVQGMRKVYPGRDGNPPKSAVKGVSFVVEKQSCLGLLGHNGAGKTTLLNMLIGLFAPSSGTAFIRGLDIRTSLDVIHSMIGICPQHDVLWDNLTGKEHLMFYGRIKGLKGDDLKNEVKYLLEKVKLTSARNKVSKKYSGGMKRRLSVAIALMGAPQVVFLDEPSTGLDPKSRQDLWNVINEYKQHASIILTTHSMEEADALCDRIMIMADGNAKCVGVSADLKGRFGEGYKLSATVQKGANGEDLHKYILSFLPDARLLNELAGTRNYEIPKKGNNVSLDDVFEKMEAKKEELRIQDWAITNTTLEEVFLKISLQNKGNDAAHSVAFFSEDELAISSKKKSKAKINAKTDSNNIDENGKEEQDKDADFSSSSEDEAQEQKDGSIRTDESQELP